MLTMTTFARDATLPSYWANVLGRTLSLLAENFTLTTSDSTHLRVPAGADKDAAILSVAGRWRYVEANVTRAHPGGAAGTYDVFVTAKENNIVSSPQPYTDNTDYSFDLAIVAAGATPTIVAGTVDVYRRVGSCQWSGSAITRIDQDVPATARHAHRHATGQPDAIAPSDIGAVGTSDSRLTDARSPTAHASRHQPGGSDAMAVDVTGAGSLRTLGTGAQQAASGNDSRITGALQKADNLAALADKNVARQNLRLGWLAKNYRQAGQGLTPGVWTPVLMDAIPTWIDPDSRFAGAYYPPIVPGYYEIKGALQVSCGSNPTYLEIGVMQFDGVSSWVITGDLGERMVAPSSFNSIRAQISTVMLVTSGQAITLGALSSESILFNTGTTANWMSARRVG